ncbi:MAG: hypothetical protein AAGC88_15425, partial [Bacteroidota bacterium]
LAFKFFPDYTSYGNQSLMRLLSVLATNAKYSEFDLPMEKLGMKLLNDYEDDPYTNVYLAFYFSSKNDNEKAYVHFKRLADAENFRPFWYTIEALDFLGDYHKSDNPELSKKYFQRIIDIGWNMGGKLDKAKSELKNDN